MNGVFAVSLVFLKGGMATVANGQLCWWNEGATDVGKGPATVFFCVDAVASFFVDVFLVSSPGLGWCLTATTIWEVSSWSCWSWKAFPKEPSLALAPVTSVCRPCGRSPIILGMFRVQFTPLGQTGATAFLQPGLLYKTKPAVGKTPLSSHRSAAMDEFIFYLLDF